MHRDAGSDVTQLHTGTFRNEQQLAPGSVLVVGGGNSGIQIAAELAENRPVYLSVGQSRLHLPERILGKPVFSYMRALGLLTAPAESWLGKRLSSVPDPIIGYHGAIRRLMRSGQLRMMPRTLSLAGQTAFFADGSTARVSNIIWATGYRSDYGWLAVPGALDEYGRPLHTRGVSPVPGLYYLGLPWQRNRQSALMGGVSVDARLLADDMIRFLNS
ncbi:hypothetical protein ACFSO0_19145 [Brevibacillus sp. GCM10020057]|uniref:hypothetical protein n=1 Tax=Brevibacillus sp. GCM10020057 TaxID=3317327 RepID=UPI003632A180